MSKYKEGDIVQIMPLTEAEKRRYPSTWVRQPPLTEVSGLQTLI